MSPRTTHSPKHNSVTHRIGAGLQRTLCQDCDYIGVSEAVVQPSDIGIMIPAESMAKLLDREPSTDPWAVAA
jgi:hypothetical protein